MLQSGVWVPEDEVERFVGTAALGRSRGYANADSIRDVVYRPGNRTLSGRVRGSGTQWYQTEVAFGAPDPSGWSRPKLSTCTCPVAMRCKHAAALMLFAGAGAGAGSGIGADVGAPEAGAAVPEWRRLVSEALHRAVSEQPRREPEVYGLQLSLVPDETVDDGWAGGLRPGLGNRLRARIVVPGRGGRWKSAGVEWDRLRYGWTAEMTEAQSSWFRALDVLARSRRQARVWLDLCDAEVPALWPLIATAAEAEVEIVPDDGLLDVVPGPRRRVGLTAWSPDGKDVVVTAAAEELIGEAGERDLPRETPGDGADGGGRNDDGGGRKDDDDNDDDERGHPLPGALVGDRGDMVAVVSGRVLELCPVGRLEPGVARDLRRWRQLTIPDEAVAEFCGEFLTDLADAFPMTDRIGRLELPQPAGVAFELVIRRYAGPDAAAGPDLLLEWFRLDLMRMSDGTETARRRPLTDLDLGRAGPAYADPETLELAGRVDEAGWGWLLSAGPGRVGEHAAAVLLADGVAALRAIEGVRVTVQDGVPQVRRATEGPRIAVTTEDDSSGIDWLGLSVAVTVEGRPVPFATVFKAVVSGQDEFVTEDGVLVPVDLERFGELRTLLEEALAASAARAGQTPEFGRIKIGLGQAGVFADLSALADDLTPPSGRARALLELASDTPSPVPVPAALQAELRPYQQEGLDWLAMLWRHRIGGILADDMGLGKTVQSLALIAHAHEVAGRGADGAGGGSADDAGADGDATRPPGPFLVVAPSSVVPNWEAEARKFVPSLRVARRSATEAKSESTVAHDAAASDIVVTSATVLRLDAQAYAEIDWAGVFLDEAQQAKNPGSKLFAAIAGLRADFLIAVTGTPMENNLTELWAVAALSCRGVLPDIKDFRTRFRNPIEKHGDTEALALLRRRLRPFLLRRRKELVAGELPPRTDAVVEVELTAAHRRVYERELARQRASLLALLDDFESNRITILAGLTVLRRLCLDPSLVDPDHASIPSAKTDELITSLREVVEEGHRALVFSQFTTYLDTVVDRLRDEGISVAHLDGRTTDRAGAVGQFTEGGAQVFCLSLKAGGVGLNLVGADYVFLLDPWWNPATEAQAVDRAHRIGQTRPVLVYRMVARDTIEERVVELQQRKAELFASVLDSGEHFSAALTADDLRGLLG